jgi:hypothetical protein
VTLFLKIAIYLTIKLSTMAENTNQVQKEALMKGSPWLKDLMLNPHLNKFMKDFEKEYMKRLENPSFNLGRFSIRTAGYPPGYGSTIIITFNDNHITDDGKGEMYDKVNVFELILRYAFLHKGTMLHIADPGITEKIIFCDPKDIVNRGKKESTFFDIFYLCKHRAKVEDKKHHEFTKYHNNNL